MSLKIIGQWLEIKAELYLGTLQLQPQMKAELLYLGTWLKIVGPLHNQLTRFQRVHNNRIFNSKILILILL